MVPRFALKINFRVARMAIIYLLLLLILTIIGYVISSSLYNQIEYQSITKLPY